MNIKTKLNIITGIVVTFAVIIIATTTITAIDDRANINQAFELNELSQKLSLLIHETQKERGASAGFLGSKGTKFVDIMPKQRINTDDKNANLTTYLDTLDINSFPT